MVKILGIDRLDGKKSVRLSSKDQKPILFGWQAISGSARSVVITEGEIDTMSMYQYGYDALSVPFGGGGGNKHAWIEHEFHALERFDTILVCMDHDETGKVASAEIIERLGRHRCKNVELPFKDANECLIHGVTKKQMAEFVESAQTLDPEELKSASSFTSEVIKEFYPPPGFDLGFYTPWPKIGSQLMFRPGEVTVLAGVNGHGKSEGAGHITLDALSQGVKACVGSLEFRPQKWLYRMTRQASGIMEPSIPYIKTIQKWYSDKLWVFDVVGTAKAARILEVFGYARQRYDTKLFIIDNLSKLDIGLDDYNRQRDFVDQLTDFAKEHHCHVILVAHMRKSNDDSQPSSKMDIKGTGSITDLVDTVLIWWRNRPKEEKIRKAGDNAIDTKLLSKPDAYIRCEKQRNGECEPVIGLWFDKKSHQFLERHNNKPNRYVKFKEGSL